MNFSNAHFSVRLLRNTHSVVLVMQVLDKNYYTDIFPQITTFLETHAPDVLKTTCYNSANLTFPQEVVNTEIGHFFEHLVITYLYEEKIKRGEKGATYQAFTEWDWEKYPTGSFKISITSKVQKDILEIAIARAIQTTELLFASHVIN